MSAFNPGAYEAADALFGVKSKKLEFCLYTPGESDYWGEFDTQRELFEWMGQAGNFVYDSASSDENRAFYRDGDKLILVTGI